MPHYKDGTEDVVKGKGYNVKHEITIFVPADPADPAARAEREAIVRAVRAAIGETRPIVAHTGAPPGPEVLFRARLEVLRAGPGDVAILTIPDDHMVEDLTDVVKVASALLKAVLPPGVSGLVLPEGWDVTAKRRWRRRALARRALARARAGRSREQIRRLDEWFPCELSATT